MVCLICNIIIIIKLQASSITTSAVRSDIDSAAKYIGAGAATVGVAGAGMLKILSFKW